MAKQTIDSFIEHSSALFEAFPSTTILSFTYSNEKKKAGKRKSVDIEDENSKKASNAVTFKCYEPSFGKCIKYKTNKVKELSRLLTFVGPRGVNVSKKRERTEDTDEKANKRIKVDITSEFTPGLASIMSNTKFDGEEDADAAAKDTQSPTPIADNKDSSNNVQSVKSKNKKKKKNKK